MDVPQELPSKVKGERSNKNKTLGAYKEPPWDGKELKKALTKLSGLKIDIEKCFYESGEDGISKGAYTRVIRETTTGTCLNWRIG